MYTAWFVISITLAVIWIIAFIGGIAVFVFDFDDQYGPRLRDKQKEDFRIFSAIMAGGLVFVVAHWIVLLLVVPVFFVYGLVQAAKMPFKRKSKEQIV